MTRVAFLTASCMLPGNPGEREDSFEHAHEMAQLKPSCAAAGVDLVEVVWNHPDLRPCEFDAFVVGTTWDYQANVNTFLSRLEEIERERPLYNRLSTLRWNLHKSYLADLAARGVLTVPTRWVERADAPSIDRAFEALATDQLVVKAQVGACAWRQALVRRGEELPAAEELPPAEAMIQPYLPSAVSEGEYSYLFFDRVFSHCARKSPQAGDYRVQSVFGGIERVHNPTPEDLAVAQAAVDAVDGPLLYARVDLMRLPDGRLALMELELVEPYLYPEQGPHMGEAFATALTRMLGGLTDRGWRRSRR